MLALIPDVTEWHTLRHNLKAAAADSGFKPPDAQYISWNRLALALRTAIPGDPTLLEGWQRAVAEVFMGKPMPPKADAQGADSPILLACERLLRRAKGEFDNTIVPRKALDLFIDRALAREKELEETLASANALIGEAADEAKRMQDRYDTLHAAALEVSSYVRVENFSGLAQGARAIEKLAELVRLTAPSESETPP